MRRLQLPDDVPRDSHHFRLLDELYKLHARAGRPGTRQMASGCSFSHTVVHQMFTSNRVPRFPVLMGVVENLLTTAPYDNKAETRTRFDELWHNADDEEAAQTQTNIDIIEAKDSPLGEDQLLRIVELKTTLQSLLFNKDISYNKVIEMFPGAGGWRTEDEDRIRQTVHDVMYSAEGIPSKVFIDAVIELTNPGEAPERRIRQLLADVTKAEPS